MSLAQFLASIKEVQLGFLLYSSSILTPLGVVLNCFSMAVFLRRRLRSTTMSFYNVMLAVCNILALVSIASQFFTTAIRNDATIISTASCKTIHYLERVFIHASSWTQVAMTVDRMIVISFPNRFRLVKDRRAISVVMTVVFLAIFALNFAALTQSVVYTYTNTTAGNVTTLTRTAKCTSSLGFLLTRDVISLMLRSVLPFLIMTGSNIVLIRAIVLSKRRIKAKQAATPAKKEYQLAYSIVALNVLYLFTNCPIAIILIMTDYFTFVTPGSSQFMAVLLTTQYVSVYLGALNYVLTFVMNYYFNSIFRRELFLFLQDSFGRWLKVDFLFTKSASNTADPFSGSVLRNF